MKTVKIVLVVLITLGILTGTGFFLIGFLQPKPAGILVNTSPASSVYINGAFAGGTPFQKTLASGEIDLKLVPNVSDQNLLPFETKITLSSGIQTAVRREFAKTEDESSGDIISFERDGESGAALIVISTPDNAQVSVDGVVKGFTPLKTSSISPAQHQITIKALGYSDRTVTVNTRAGFRLTLFAKLAKTSEVVNPTPTSTPIAKTFIEILSTPTGYLRVRTEAGSAGEEIAQVKPGEKYLYLGENSDATWYKIQFEDAKPGLPNGIVGWVSAQYSKKIEDTTPSPTPSNSIN